MLNLRQLSAEIIEPTINLIGRGGDDAIALLLGTALVESRCEYVRQLGGGPALGIYQMEPVTHSDIWVNYLSRKYELRRALVMLLPARLASNTTTDIGLHAGWCLIWDLRYATAMARVHYLRVPEPIPDRRSAAAMARYWKRHWNTPKGAGDPAKFEELYDEHVHDVMARRVYARAGNR